MRKTKPVCLHCDSAFFSMDSPARLSGQQFQQTGVARKACWLCVGGWLLEEQEGGSPGNQKQWSASENISQPETTMEASGVGKLICAGSS